jgi:hypothetical protein
MATHSRLRHLNVAECDEGSLLRRLLLMDPPKIMHCAKKNEIVSVLLRGKFPLSQHLT